MNFSQSKPPHNIPLKWRVEDPIDNMPDQLADMHTNHNKPVRIVLDEEATRISLDLMRLVESTASYQALCDMLPSVRVPMYFEKAIRDAVYPALRTLFVCEWYQSQYGTDQNFTITWSTHRGLGPLLQGMWPSKKTVLRPSIWIHAEPRKFAKSLLKCLRIFRFARRKPIQLSTQKPCIGIHINEGVENTKRSDLFWYTPESIDPSDIILILNNTISTYRGKKTPEQVLKEFDEKELQWVCLKNNLVDRRNTPTWTAPFIRGPLYKAFVRQHHKLPGSLEYFVRDLSKTLLEEVDYWIALFQELGLKLFSTSEQGNLRNVAQCIALDFVGGIRVGWQRSEARLVTGSIGTQPNHVYFTWNSLASSDAESNRSRIDATVISGFPYNTNHDTDSQTVKIRNTLTDANVKLTIALFDNFFWWGGLYSQDMISEFYSTFLSWVTEDPDVAVITKSKKLTILELLPRLKPLMAHAERTGRWINFPDPDTRLPSDASKLADISIGIGISSAISEAVAQGYRGVHVALNKLYSHTLYKWGYWHVIFDDLTHLVDKLKVFKLEKELDDTLGKFDKHIETIDSFHDGKGGNRISEYLEWLWESLKQGQTNSVAITNANNLYSKKWGANKINSKVHTL